MIGTLAVVLAVCGIAGVIVYQTLETQKNREVTAGNSYDMGSGYRTITWNGEEYQYNSTITAVLFAGVDSAGELKSTAAYGNKGRADTILLAVLDKKNSKLTVLSFNRDTMTEIRRYTRIGTDLGTYVTHLGYAYTWGDGGAVSCENLAEAVSAMLGGIPVTEYVAAGQSSIEYVNALAGGVTVTVPNGDLAEEYPELTEGAVVTLDDTTVRAFVQSRDTGTDFSNEGRMERQKAYVTAFVAQFKERLVNDTQAMWDEANDFSQYIVTNITKNKYLTMANLMEQIDFSDADFYIVEGEDRQGEDHDEFYYDEEALAEKVVEIFYEKIG